MTLKSFMAEDEGLKELGGPAYLVKLAGASISAFAVHDYAQMIYDLAIRRELIRLGRDISDKAARVDVSANQKNKSSRPSNSFTSYPSRARPNRDFNPSSRRSQKPSTSPTKRTSAVVAWRGFPPVWPTWTNNLAVCTRPT